MILKKKLFDDYNGYIFCQNNKTQKKRSKKAVKIMFVQSSYHRFDSNDASQKRSLF